MVFRLIRYLYPTNDELRTLAGVPKDKPKSKKDYRNRYNENGKTGPDMFHIPRSLDIQVRSLNYLYFVFFFSVDSVVCHFFNSLKCFYKRCIKLLEPLLLNNI